MTGFVKSALNLFGIKTGNEVENVGSLDEFLGELARQVGYDIRFKKEDKEGSAVHFEIEGPEAQDFLGENSNMIEALSHISMRIMRKQAGFSNQPLGEESDASKFRVTFDSRGFREMKNQQLKELAEKARGRVIESGGRIFYLPALSPSERKVIHTHLAELGEVTSESIGTGTFKRIRVKLLPNSPHRRERPQGEGSGGNRRGGGGGGGGRGARGGRGGRGRGRGRGGPGRGGFNQGQEQNGNLAQDENYEFQDEINGNVAESPDSPAYLDDNIGNRRRPGDDDGYGGERR
jgi:predicted RNA-binding protein Jag